MANITITIPDALIDVYSEAVIARAARAPLNPLPPPTRANLEVWVAKLLKTYTQGEQFNGATLSLTPRQVEAL